MTTGLSIKDASGNTVFDTTGVIGISCDTVFTTTISSGSRAYPSLQGKSLKVCAYTFGRWNGVPFNIVFTNDGGVPGFTWSPAFTASSGVEACLLVFAK